MRQQFGEILSVAVALELGGESVEPCIVDPAESPGDFLGTGDLEALPCLDRGNEFGGLPQALRRSGIEPGEAAAKLFDVELLGLQVAIV